jgi:hypothetical protein
MIGRRNCDSQISQIGESSTVGGKALILISPCSLLPLIVALALASRQWGVAQF